MIAYLALMPQLLSFIKDVIKPADMLSYDSALVYRFRITDHHAPTFCDVFRVTNSKTDCI